MQGVHITIHYRWPPCRAGTIRGTVTCRAVQPCRPCRARPCYGPGLQPMTRHMGRLHVPCRPWATVHACELVRRSWKERERAGRGRRGEEARRRRCGRRRRRCGLVVGMRGEEARCGRAGTVSSCRSCRAKAVSRARPAAHDPHGPSCRASTGTLPAVPCRPWAVPKGRAVSRAAGPWVVCTPIPSTKIINLFLLSILYGYSIRVCNVLFVVEYCDAITLVSSLHFYLQNLLKFLQQHARYHLLRNGNGDVEQHFVKPLRKMSISIPYVIIWSTFHVFSKQFSQNIADRILNCTIVFPLNHVNFGQLYMSIIHICSSLTHRDKHTLRQT
jgi:hypothetical protein